MVKLKVADSEVQSWLKVVSAEKGGGFYIAPALFYLPYLMK